MKEPRSLDKAEENGGYSWIENSFIDEILTTLPPRAVQLYLYLVRNAPQGKKYDPVTKPLSMIQIGQVLGCSRETVAKAIDALESCGAIEKVKRRGGANRYRLLATCLENLAGVAKETGQGCQENLTPPDKKTSQVNAANDCDTETGGTSKSILRVSKNLRTGLRPSETPTGCGPRRV